LGSEFNSFTGPAPLAQARAAINRLGDIHGYQTLINDSLGRLVETGNLEADLRRVIREALSQ
jgi:hypothetical protein